MNINNWSGKKKVAALLLVILGVVGIVLTLFLVQRQQELRSRAEKATNISLTPSSKQAQAGEEVALDVVVTPGTNQVGFVTLDINYDPDAFLVADDAFELDPSTGFQILSSGQVVTPGEYKVTVSAGSDPTNVIQSAAKKLGTFRVTVNSTAEIGTYDVSINQQNTLVTSIGGGDDFSENVLNTVGNSKIIVGGGICKPFTGTCSWDSVPNADRYHYEVIRDDQNQTVILSGEENVTSVEFKDEDLEPGNTFNYICKVYAVSDCGEGGTAEGSSECSRPSVTPTPTTTLTPTPTKTGTPTPTHTVTPTPTVPDDNTPTPTTPEEEEFTPTPTKVTVVVTQPTQPGQPGVGGVETVNTPTPTIAETGNPVVYGGIIGGILFVLGGIALLFL